MGQITWNTDVNAPCCPGEIVNDDGRTLLIQTDWDFPGTASTFGWSLRSVQKCPACGSTDCTVEDDIATCDNCDCRCRAFEPCEHDGTDGTVKCEECGCNPGDFIHASGNWLSDNDGLTADDPGYFDCED